MQKRNLETFYLLGEDGTKEEVAPLISFPPLGGLPGRNDGAGGTPTDGADGDGEAVEEVAVEEEGQEKEEEKQQITIAKEGGAEMTFHLLGVKDSAHEEESKPVEELDDSDEDFVHEKESAEQDAGVEGGLEEEVLLTASTPPPMSAITANAPDGVGASSSAASHSKNSPAADATLSPPHPSSDVEYIQSDHIAPQTFADNRLKVLAEVDNVNVFNNGAYHLKKSEEQDGRNELRHRPIPWSPEPETETELAPRAPEGEDDAGRVYCKSTEGSFGAKKGGVVLRYQYEVSVLNTGGGGLDDVLPRLENGITDSLLPVWFEDECLDLVGVERSGTGVVRLGPLWRRNLRGGDQRRRRLNKVVGIDSLPIDLPLRGKECSFADPATNARCYVMEGALTLYFPPNYSIHTVVQGAHLTTLRAIQSDMANGMLAQRSHPRIRKLTFLESSYDLAWEFEPTDVGSVDKGAQKVEAEDKPKKEQGAIGGLIAGVVVLILLLCCFGGCFWMWTRRGGAFKDLFPPPGMKVSAVQSEDEDAEVEEVEEVEERDILQRNLSKRRLKNKNSKRKKKKKKKKKGGVSKRTASDRSIQSVDSESEDEESQLHPFSENTSQPVSEDMSHAASEDNMSNPISGDMSSMLRRRSPRRKKGGSRGSSQGTIVQSSQDSGSDYYSSSRSGRTSLHSMHSSLKSKSSRSSKSSGQSSQSSQSLGTHSRGSAGTRQRQSTLPGVTEEEDWNGTTTSSDSSEDENSTTSSGSDDSSTTSSDFGSTTEGSTTTSSRGGTTNEASTSSTSTSDDDNNSTTTSTSDTDNDSTTSTTSSDDEEAAGDQFDLGGFHAEFMSQRRGVRDRQGTSRRARAQRGRGARTRQGGGASNNNLIMTGGKPDDDVSVMTGMTGATGIHSVSSQATAQVANRRVPMSVGGGGDDLSVMTGVTGVSGATQKVSNKGLARLPQFGLRNDNVGSPGGGGLSFSGF